MKKESWEANGQEVKLSNSLVLDWYHLLQAYILFREKRHEERVIFDYFIRKTLPKCSYNMVVGTEEVLRGLACMKFSKNDIIKIKKEFSKKSIELPEEFIQYLKTFRFNADVWVIREGDLAFPNEPIIRVEGGYLESFIVESFLLSRMNYPSGVGTKASRIVKAAGGIPLAEFGLRRSPNPEVSTRAAMIGGFDSTSYVGAGIKLEVPITGTSAHALVQGFAKLYGGEKEAFKIILKYTDTLPIDTFLIRQGIMNAIAAAKEMNKKISIRIDSGDLIGSVFLARELDTEGRISRIILSNDLDDKKVDDIRKSGAKVDSLGVGTYLVNPFPPVGGVYKLVAIRINGVYEAATKISGDEIKELLPGKKEIWRRVAKNGKFAGDLIALASEPNPGKEYEPVLVQAIDKGKIILPYLKVLEIRNFSKERLSHLSEKHCRIEKPLAYKVKVSQELLQLKKMAVEEMTMLNLM